ncbi:MAG: hypothetical protein L0Z53_22495, partial [Acidobacteriales bacterium]|nr:hypothetical protein [Terriglobales bacterium]
CHRRQGTRLNRFRNLRDSLTVPQAREKILIRTFMQTNALPSIEVEDFTLGDRPSITVLVVYEDDASRERAMRAEAQLAQNLSSSVNVRFSWWKLKLFFHPRIMQLATEALRKADIVLFAISVGGELPLVARAWIEAELGNRDCHQCGLLALLETGAGGLPRPSPAELFLSDVARNAGLDFLSQATDAIYAGTTSNAKRQDHPRSSGLVPNEINSCDCVIEVV